MAITLARRRKIKHMIGVLEPDAAFLMQQLVDEVQRLTKINAALLKELDQ